MLLWLLLKICANVMGQEVVYYRVYVATNTKQGCFTMQDFNSDIFLAEQRHHEIETRTPVLYLTLRTKSNIYASQVQN